MQQRHCRAVQSSSREKSIEAVAAADSEKIDDAFGKQQASLKAEQWQ